MQQKYELGTRLNYFWHKNEKIISQNFNFVFEPLHFQHTCPSFLLSNKVNTNKVNAICGGGQLLVSGSQVLISRVSGSHVPDSEVPSLRVPVPVSQVPGSQVTGLRSWVLGLRIPSLRVPGLGSWFWTMPFYNMVLVGNLHWGYLLINGVYR